MGRARFKIYFIILTAIPCAVAAQVSSETDSAYNRILDSNPRIFKSHDTVWIYTGICKRLKTTILIGKTATPYLNKLNLPSVPFLKVHGNIQYDFTYRSFVDTPFSQTGFAQHTIQTTLDFTIRDQYPVRMTLLHRNSNSPYFDDITDVNVQFNQGMFINQLKTDLNKKIPDIINKNKLPEIERLYQQKKWEVEALQGWISHPARLQEIIESKEKEAAARIIASGQAMIDSQGIRIPSAIPSVPLVPGRQFLQKKVFAAAEQRMKNLKDSLEAKADSLIAKKKNEKDSLLDNDLMARCQQKKQELDKAIKDLKNYEGKIKSVKKTMQDSINLLKQQLSQIKDPAQLKIFIQQHKLNAKDLPKGWQTLAAINTIGIGRTWVDYSDLTVKNISLTGINAELSPSKFYFAFAAGRVNYRFRDFVVKNSDRPKQTLYLLRAGIGRKEGNNLIVTWYDGKKNMLNSFRNSSVSSNLERVIGMSVQTRLQLDANNYIILESAKSSFHNTGTINQPTEGLAKKVWNFKDRSNEAYSVKLYSNWPQTSTRVTGYYRKMGEHFQSFNLQPINVIQEAYQFKVQQQLWKRRLQIEAGIRKNDFNSPFISPGFASKTVFKTLQATLRIPKYPFVSVGYYPSSQLTLLDNNVIVENQYNTLSTVISHAYRIKNISMSSSVVLLKFYNSGADTGFIYYNATSVTVNQFIFLKGLQLQSGLTFTSQRDLKVTTLEQSANYQLREWLTVNGGLKYNRVNSQETLWGAIAGLGVMIKKIGTVQASYEKSYLPGTARNLLPVDMGRVTYCRVF
ncbi:MAG: hypothetical protein SGI83_00985 [Bacteroidota bacterium]|nr:hypothetical protein [Bacteroidota bacterium]